MGRSSIFESDVYVFFMEICDQRSLLL